METISGPNNWLLSARRDSGGVTLLRCATPDTDAVLPDTLWGLPVTTLADHALAPSVLSAGTLPAGNPSATDKIIELRMVCGQTGDAPWDNSILRNLTLPPALRRVENYALYHCLALEQLRLHDGVSFWGSGVLTGCRALQSVEIVQASKNLQDLGLPSASAGTIPFSPGGTLAYLAGELSQELDATVYTPDGPLLRLIFPAYRELYEENTPAHHFDYVIEGAGYPYHHCFRNRTIHLPTYDSLWTRFREAGDSCALRLAWWRLRYPAELSAAAEAAYRDYLRTHGREAAAWLIQERDIHGLAFFLGLGEHGRDLFTYALSLAREQRATEAAALLLDEQHRRFPVRNRFAL